VGRIFIEEGNIIHAHGDGLTGEPALQRLLALPGGSFELTPFGQPDARSIEGQWESLLMEAARMRDEGAAQIASQPPEEPVTDASAVSVRVAEMLICTGTGEPLYQADCADVNARVVQLKRILQQGAELAQTLSLGEFDRLEMQFTDGRAIAQARPDRFVFVRTANHIPGS
jgi:hypothetical protein